MNSRIVMRQRHAQRVLCDADFYRKPIIPRRYKTAAAIAAYSVLMTFLLIACAFLGGLP